MTQPKWTKGPWRLGADLAGVCVGCRDGNGNPVDWLARNGYAKTVAKITNPSWMGVDQSVANGRLIAASPDLYEELENVLDALGALSNPAELENLLGKERADCVFAALAKARGETP